MNSKLDSKSNSSVLSDTFNAKSIMGDTVFTPRGKHYITKSGDDTNGNADLNKVEQNQRMFHYVKHHMIQDIQYELSQVMDINMKDEYGNNLLIIAVKNNFLDIVQLLLTQGIDTNAVDSNGNTALHYSESSKFVKISELLILHGADEFVQNNNGLTCYEMVVDSVADNKNSI